jgi:hypothetical protein
MRADPGSASAGSVQDFKDTLTTISESVIIARSEVGTAACGPNGGAFVSIGDVVLGEVPVSDAPWRARAQRDNPAVFEVD